MNRIILGRTRASVSAIGLGTWSYGGPSTVNNMSVGWGGQQDDGHAQLLLRAGAAAREEAQHDHPEHRRVERHRADGCQNFTT